MRFRVGFTGAGGTGKTTVLDLLVPMLRQSKLVVESVDGGELKPLHSRARDILKRHGVTDKDQRSPDQEWDLQREMLEDRLAAERERESFISDRTMIDHLAYCMLRCWNMIDDDMFETYRRLLSQNLLQYDLIVYFPIYWKTSDDAVRGTKECYQHALDMLIYRMFSEFVRMNTDASVIMPCVSPGDRSRLITNKIHSIIYDKART